MTLASTLPACASGTAAAATGTGTSAAAMTSGTMTGSTTGAAAAKETACKSSLNTWSTHVSFSSPRIYQSFRPILAPLSLPNLPSTKLTSCQHPRPQPQHQALADPPPRVHEAQAAQLSCLAQMLELPALPWQLSLCYELAIGTRIGPRSSTTSRCIECLGTLHMGIIHTAEIQ